MNCKIFEDKIWDYLDGSMADDVREDCQSHVTACSKCSAELEASKAILSEARSIEKAKAPDLLWQRIEAELDAPRVPFYSAIRDRMVKLMTNFENLLITPAPALKIAGVRPSTAPSTKRLTLRRRRVWSTSSRRATRIGPWPT